MKSLFIVLALISVVFVFASPQANAGLTFTFTQTQLLAMVESYDNPPGIGDLDSKTAVGTGVLFIGDINDGNPQWRSIGIGFPWADPNLPGDLSAFSDYALTFTNQNNQDWWVNLYMNTGWTDPPYNQPNNFYQNGWTELAPGQSVTLVLDFTTEGVINQNHVTNIGFQVAFNESNETFPGSGVFQGDKYHLLVNPVPEPGSLALVCMLMGGVLASWKRRRK